VFLTALALVAQLDATPFRNPDFEEAQVIINDPMFGNLDWSLALPGWQPPVDVYISQTGDVPAGSRAIELLVDGDKPLVTLNGELIPLIPVATVQGWVIRYAGDLTRSAGTTAELRIIYPFGTEWVEDVPGQSFLLSNSGTIDDIHFTARVVPEPSIPGHWPSAHRRGCSCSNDTATRGAAAVKQFRSPVDRAGVADPPLPHAAIFGFQPARETGEIEQR
jgi:hypothetical protein